MHSTIELMFDYFQRQKNIAVFDIGFIIFFETRLIVFLVNKFFYFINIKMVCQKIVIMLANQLYLNDFRYKW